MQRAECNRKRGINRHIQTYSAHKLDAAFLKKPRDMPFRQHHPSKLSSWNTHQIQSAVSQQICPASTIDFDSFEHRPKQTLDSTQMWLNSTHDYLDHTLSLQQLSRISMQLGCRFLEARSESPKYRLIPLLGGFGGMHTYIKKYRPIQWDQ